MSVHVPQPRSQWASYGRHMSSWWTPYEPRVDFIWASYQLHWHTTHEFGKILKIDPHTTHKCVVHTIRSRKIAFYIVYHILSHPSSMHEPSYSLPVSVQCKKSNMNTNKANTMTHMHRTVHRPHMLTLAQHIHNSWHIPNTNHRQTNHANNPSAGSPTETLLRLLLPLSDTVCDNLYAIPENQVLQQSK